MSVQAIIDEKEEEKINLIQEGGASEESSSLSGHIHTGMNATQDLISRRFVTKDMYIDAQCSCCTIFHPTKRAARVANCK